MWEKKMQCFMKMKSMSMKMYSVTIVIFQTSGGQMHVLFYTAVILKDRHPNE